MRSWLEIDFLNWELVVTETSSWGREFQTGITREVMKNLERLVLDGGIINFDSEGRSPLKMRTY